MSASEANWRPFWERIEKIFDPARPARDPALFAQRLPKYNSLLRLQRRLRRGGRGTDGQYSRYLVAGTVGNGKTSELYQLASRLADDRMVIYVDLFRHFEQTVGDPAASARSSCCAVSWWIPITACPRSQRPSSCCASSGFYPIRTRTHGTTRTRC